VQFAELFPDSGAPLPLYQPIAVVSSFSISRVVSCFRARLGCRCRPAWRSAVSRRWCLHLFLQCTGSRKVLVYRLAKSSFGFWGVGWAPRC